MRKLASSVLVGLLSITTLSAQVVSTATARLAIRSGIVEVQRGNAWVSINAGERIQSGERIRTGKASSAALEIGAGKVITLDELSQVLIRESDETPTVEIENGNMKVFLASEMPATVKETTRDWPIDPELRYQGDRPVIVPQIQIPEIPIQSTIIPTPTYYFVPYFVYGNRDPNAGAIVPPVVNNPTNPGYRPTQIVPPMSDPIRVPVTKP
jgi:hypothetical protein